MNGIRKLLITGAVGGRSRLGAIVSRRLRRRRPVLDQDEGRHRPLGRPADHLGRSDDRPEGGQGQVDRLCLADPELERQCRLGARRRGSRQGARLEVHADGRQGHRHRRRRRARPGDRAQARRDHPRLGLDREQQDADQAGCRPGHRRHRLARHRQAGPGRRSEGLHQCRHRPLRHRLYGRRICRGRLQRHRPGGGDQRPAVSDRRDEERRHREGDRGVHGLQAALRGQRPLRRGAAAHAGPDQLAAPALRRQPRLHPDLQRGLFRLRRADAEGRRHRPGRQAAPRSPPATAANPPTSASATASSRSRPFRSRRSCMAGS